jgi:magnesium transporter
MTDDLLTDEPPEDEALRLCAAQPGGAIHRRWRPGDADALIDALMEPLHAADIADLLEQVTADERAAWLRLWSRGSTARSCRNSTRGSARRSSGPRPAGAAEAVRELDSDDVVDLLEDLEDEQQEAILAALDDHDRTAVQQALTYPEYSAGRLMQREVVPAPEHWTVGEMPSTTCAPTRPTCPSSSTT